MVPLRGSFDNHVFLVAFLVAFQLHFSCISSCISRCISVAFLVVVTTMYNRLLLLLPCTCILVLLRFNQIIPSVNLWQTDPYLHRRARVEKACQDYKEQIEGDEERRAATIHPPDPNVLLSRKERFLWCKVPKAASTSWKTYFLKQSGKDVDGMDNVQIDRHLQLLMRSPR